MKMHVIFVASLVVTLTGAFQRLPLQHHTNISPRVGSFLAKLRDGQEPKTDWDAEFSKLKASEESNEKIERPGDIDVNTVEFQYKKARNQAVRSFNKVVPDGTVIEIPSVSWKKLQNDWRFWAGLIAVISLLPVVFGALAPQAPPVEYIVLGGSDPSVDVLSSSRAFFVSTNPGLVV
mmetsp:Transcript_68803/g.138328  ORF Transcript_68803/g.138328 Transcript_68803/m.138328 type:complete len:177 (+) Transcript_68803:91-621(+)